MDKEQWNPLKGSTMIRFLEKHHVGNWAVMKDQKLWVNNILVTPGQYVVVHADGTLEAVDADQ